VKAGRAYLYAALAVAVAATYGIGVGPYWVTDMLVFAVAAGVVAWLCFSREAKEKDIEAGFRLKGGSTGGGKIYRSAELRSVVSEPDQIERVPRSRIAHYVIISRSRSTKLADWLRRESDSPFERALLSEPGWRTLSGEGLGEITRKALDTQVKSTQ